VFSLFYKFLEEKEAFLKESGLKSKLGKTRDSINAIDYTELVFECTSARAPKPWNERRLHYRTQEEGSIAKVPSCNTPRIN
jgi:hypothetical protein